MTDANRQVVWAASFEPFGKTRITTELVVNNFRMPGQVADSESGLSYNWWRYYKNYLGRYLTPDPLDQSAASPIHQYYGYAGLNPIRLVDPLGLWPACGHRSNCDKWGPKFDEAYYGWLAQGPSYDIGPISNLSYWAGAGAGTKVCHGFAAEVASYLNSSVRSPTCSASCYAVTAWGYPIHGKVQVLCKEAKGWTSICRRYDPWFATLLRPWVAREGEYEPPGP